MRKIVLILLIFTSLNTLTQCNSKDKYVINAPKKTKKSKEKEEIKFDHLSHDFGEVRKGRIVSYTYKFTNIGKKTIIINDVIPSCGCTTPNYTKKPILPKEEGSIDVSFNSSYFVGDVYKNVKIVGSFGTKVIDFKAIIK